MFTPKSLLRHKLAVSKLSEMAEGSRFQFVIPEIDDIGPAEKVRRVVMCSGKVYYDLLQERRAKQLNDVAIIRLEQFYPFPDHTLGRILKPYVNADVVWCQEEPENMGAWRFMGPRIGYLLEEMGRGDVRIKYAGRPEAASPAAGYAKIHIKEQEQLIDDALSGKSSSLLRKLAVG